MVKPLREAYEHYENKRIEDEKLRRAREKRRSNEDNARSMSKEEIFPITEPRNISDSFHSTHELMKLTAKHKNDDITENEKQVNTNINTGPLAEFSSKGRGGSGLLVRKDTRRLFKN